MNTKQKTGLSASLCNSTAEYLFEAQKMNVRFVPKAVRSGGYLLRWLFVSKVVRFEGYKSVWCSGNTLPFHGKAWGSIPCIGCADIYWVNKHSPKWFLKIKLNSDSFLKVGK